MIYQFREPEAIVSSFLYYRSRDPNWYRNYSDEHLFNTLTKSFDCLLKMARSRGGIVLDYENLLKNYKRVLTNVYNRLWFPVPQSAQMAKAASVLLAREKRLIAGATSFLDKNTKATFSNSSETLIRFKSEMKNLRKYYRSLKRFKQM